MYDEEKVKGYIPINIEDIMHSAYLQYSLSVNIGRAIPDVRDGLKPGNRRILFAMRQLGLTHSHAYSKCAKVVGEVIGNYHPHGDQSIYDTLVRMAQDFSMRYPLIDGQGNFGSVDGDSPAAYRYTECRMQRLAEELLTDLDKETVDKIPNFDESIMEPTVLPAGFPNLLVNGTTGIGVGMATNIPPHNLGEVIDGVVHLIDNPTATPMELMQFIKGPDFPTGATIMGIQPIIDLYETGHGIISVRAKAKIEELDTGRERIVITEIPYAVNKEMLIKKIADLVNHKVITGLSALNDESSSRVGIRIVADVKTNARAEIVLNQLFKHTPLQSSFGSTFLVVHKNTPTTMNLPQVLQAYIDHRLEVITRRSQFELKKAKAREHILEGLLKAVDNIDEIVSIIRSSRTKDEAATNLITRFEFSRKQTNAILEMRLHQLTGLARDELNREFEEVKTKIDYLESLLADKELRMGVVKDELIVIKEKYADPRRTEIQTSGNEINIEDLITRSICAITVSNTGYIKRLPVDLFRTQHRGGKGVKAMETKEEDFVRQLFTACTHDYIFFFTNKGLMHWLKVYEIPEGQRTGRGKAIVNLLELQPEEQLRAMLTVEEVDVEDRYLIFATRRGIIKKTRLSAFKHMRHKAIKALVLEDDDDLIDVQLSNGDNQVMLFTSQGMAGRFEEKQVRPTGRVGKGMIGIRLKKENDGVVALAVVDKAVDILNITENGMGKRSNIGTGNAEEDREQGGGYRLTNRGSKGVTSIKLKPDDQVIAALQVESGDEIMITTVNGQLVRINTDEIRSIGRSSQGVKVIDLRGDDRVTGVSRIQELDDDEGTDSDESPPELDEAPATSEAVEKSVDTDESAKKG